ncbi:MAG: metal ABC transporter permease, partial [Alphaproteobacteria bacterium]
MRRHGRHSGGSLYQSPAAENATLFSVMRALLPFVWPKDRPDLKRRVVLAGFVLVAAKLVTVATPLAYKAAV